MCVCVERFASTLSTWVSPWESQQHACMHPLHYTDQVKRLQKQTSLEPVKTLILLVENTFHLGLFHNSNIIFRNVELFKKIQEKKILKENNESDEILENLSFCQNEILHIIY